MTDPRGQGLPLGGTGLTCDAYLDFLSKEYLAGYLRSGGAAVRFVVVGDEDVASRWHDGLAAVTAAEGYLRVAVDAAETKVHMIDQLYAAVARSVDWDALVRRTVAAAWGDIGMSPPSRDEAARGRPGVGPGGGLSVATVAAHHDMDVREAARSIRRRLEETLLRDTSLAREFRVAVLRLCQAELDTGDVTDEEQAAVRAWLLVQPVGLRALKSASLYGRVGRHNARAMLVSLAAWMQRTAGTGLVVDLDVTRLALARRPPVEERTGTYYTKATILDAYEVLRQLVDMTDQLRGVLVAVALPPELVTDDARGLPAYSALQLRIVDEVRDRRRANPFAALVRLETRLEVTT